MGITAAGALALAAGATVALCAGAGAQDSRGGAPSAAPSTEVEERPAGSPPTHVEARAAASPTQVETRSATPAPVAAPAAAPPPTRVEARSASLLAVGIVAGDRMSIHVSRLADNAPLRTAVLTVMLRGVTHPTVAEADGSYTVRTKDLELPGSAAVEFDITDGSTRERLRATLQPAVAAGSAKPEDGNSVRQLGWWVLNFGVCIAFLWLFSRRRKAARD